MTGTSTPLHRSGPFRWTVVVAVPLVLMAAMQWTIAASHSAVVLLPAYVLYYMGVYAVQAAFWPIPSSAIRDSDAAVGLAAIGSIGLFGGFAGPYLWGLARQYTGNFVLGHLCVGACLLLAAALVLRLKCRSTRALPFATGNTE